MTSVSPRRSCPSCGRSVAVVAGKFVRHDPRTHEGAELKLCPGSKRRAPLDATQRTLAAFELSPTPGQLPLF
ncbi:hypothetical protein AB0M94_09080 [Streptomyces xanthochromogenes]|uniref:hypothetical protein n=1 Tax=Streptomyces TaxID=1883 RepID=UPI00137185A1|nr:MULTISPECIES: hypothetical protein [Streptomyces]MYV94282.1 hypothetical protein [Streptomyces sp. SID1034]